MAADMRAETGPGASGWARGSHTCSGTAPAFEPNPTTASTNAVERTQGARCGPWAAITAKDWLPERSASSTNAKSNAAAPNWVITPYHWPARWTSSRTRWSASTNSSDVTAMSSHKNKKVPTADAAGTSSRVVTKRGSTHDPVRLESPWPV